MVHRRAARVKTGLRVVYLSKMTGVLRLPCLRMVCAWVVHGLCAPDFARLDGAAGTRHTGSMVIYKLLRAAEWAALQSLRETPGAPIDVADGYVHFSTALQVRETAEKHFAGVEGLMLLALDADRLGAALKWEPSRGGALFPHLYGPLRLSDVTWVQPLPLVNGAHVFPDSLA